MEYVTEILASASLILDWLEANATRIVALAFVILGAWTALKARAHSLDKKQLVSVIEDEAGRVTSRALEGVRVAMSRTDKIPSVNQTIDIVKKAIKDEVKEQSNTRLDKLVEKMYPKKGG